MMVGVNDVEGNLIGITNKRELTDSNVKDNLTKFPH
jgi:hypothetical protein